MHFLYFLAAVATEDTEAPGVDTNDPARTTSAAYADVMFFANDINEYIREYIRLADQKAAFVFGLCAAIVGVLYQAEEPQHWFTNPQGWMPSKVLAAVAMFCLAIGAFMSAATVFPRRKGSHSGYVFFNAIAERSSGERYANDVFKLSMRDLARERLEHCYDLARVCRRKYWWLIWAFWLAAIGTTLAVIDLLCLQR
jgi:hypothetical protein